MTIAIIGLGLIGGSVGLGLTESGFAARVLGFDRDPRTRVRALERKCVHEVIVDLSQAAHADLWVLATPPLAIPEILKRLDGLIRPTACVTDCASIKSLIVQELPSSLRSRFVGGHPMAGFQESGVEFARGNLFLDACWVLTPELATPQKTLRRIESMVYALDAKPVLMSAQEHDRHVAVLSHLPHALASVLVLLADRLDNPGIAGGSWRDLTRVAGTHPTLWAQIFSSNRTEILTAIDEVKEDLSQLEALLDQDDREALKAFFESAGKAKYRQR